MTTQQAPTFTLELTLEEAETIMALQMRRWTTPAERRAATFVKARINAEIRSLTGHDSPEWHA